MQHMSLLLRKTSLHKILVPNCLCPCNVPWKSIEELFAFFLFNNLACCFVMETQRTWLSAWRSWPSAILKQTQNCRVEVVQSLSTSSPKKFFFSQKQMLRKRSCNIWSGKCLQSQDSKIWGKRHILAPEYFLAI